MLTYKAAFKFVDGGVHAQLVDYPAVITFGTTLDETRKLLLSALIDLAEYTLEHGEALPLPNPSCYDPDADIEEPLHLHLSASTSVDLVPAGLISP
jgi:predicted RNase H-like HicB family nuclease